MLKNREFIKNIIIFAFSSFGSKSITLVLLPMYSQNLTISEYGVVDLIQTLVMLLMPLASLSLAESILKFCLDKNLSTNRELTIQTALSVLIFIFIILFIFSFLVYYFFYNDKNIFLILFFLLSISIYEYFSKYAKGTDETLVFSWSGIILSIALLIFNIYFIYFLKLGVSGFLYAQILSYICASNYLYFVLKPRLCLSFSSFDKSFFRKMLIFSLPLIPNAAMWWVFNASDRWILYYFYDSGISGSYSVANKLASILFIVNAIVFQAWQIEALKVKCRPDRDVVYKKIIEAYFVFICFCASVLIVMNNFIVTNLLSDDFSSAWKSGNALIISSVFFCSASFLGVFYMVFEKTKSALVTSLIAAILNALLNFILIPDFGIPGAAAATLISTIVIFTIRCYDSMKLVGLGLNKTRIVIISSVLCLQAIFSNNGNFYYSCVASVVIFCYMIFFVRNYFLGIIKRYVR